MKNLTSLFGMKKISFFNVFFSIVTFVFVNNIVILSPAKAYPIFAQQNYQNPREPNGRIVCANCHLAQKPVEIEVPQAVLPDSVFEAFIKIPYDKQFNKFKQMVKKEI